MSNSQIMIRITCKSGVNWITPINRTFQEAQEYFFKKVKFFVHETEEGIPFDDYVINVELVESQVFVVNREIYYQTLGRSYMTDIGYTNNPLGHPHDCIVAPCSRLTCHIKENRGQNQVR